MIFEHVDRCFVLIWNLIRVFLKVFFVFLVQLIGHRSLYVVCHRKFKVRLSQTAKLSKLVFFIETDSWHRFHWSIRFSSKSINPDVNVSSNKITEIPIQGGSDIRSDILRESLRFVEDKGWTLDAIRAGWWNETKIWWNRRKTVSFLFSLFKEFNRWTNHQRSRVFSIMVTIWLNFSSTIRTRKCHNSSKRKFKRSFQWRNFQFYQ